MEPDVKWLFVSLFVLIGLSGGCAMQSGTGISTHGDSDKGLSPLVVSRGDHRSRTVSQYLSPRPSTRGTGALPGSVWMQYAPE